MTNNDKQQKTGEETTDNLRFGMFKRGDGKLAKAGDDRYAINAHS